ncbi:GAF domain-containing protein [Maritalea mediterranea]|uniref:GAF domain-containing protein n=1 Tax=Maritalea mediterranea TaxID=2909667 RepID=A0ABS9E7L2_9HYPH|nr:GAF domain-containing protein [Maritalea mediterranea]MCF4098870.1 GAF domain-containing protein [Maritalea mediterranea]
MQELARILAQPDAETKMFELLEQDVQSKISAKLVTLMWLDYPAGRARRIYTNRPDLYPTKDSKPISTNPWYEHVIVGQNTFVANTLDEMDEQFTDKDFFAAHGCASVLNMPVVINGKTVGSLNLLHEENHFTPARVERTKELVLTAMVCIMLQQSNLNNA